MGTSPSPAVIIHPSHIKQHAATFFCVERNKTATKNIGTFLSFMSTQIEHSPWCLFDCPWRIGTLHSQAQPNSAQRPLLFESYSVIQNFNLRGVYSPHCRKTTVSVPFKMSVCETVFSVTGERKEMKTCGVLHPTQ